MIIEGSKHLITHETFGLIMNPNQIPLIPISQKASPQAPVASYAATSLVCLAGAR